MAQDGNKTSPYQGLEARAFWRSGVSDAGAYPPADIYRPKFRITRETAILTAGSCFAQHVGRVLASNGYNVIDAEPLPKRVPRKLAQRFGYGLYSARYGNIYTLRQLRQLLEEAQGNFAPALPVWEKDGRYFDALRPNVEPKGFASPELVQRARALHLKAVGAAVQQAQLVVLTLGLTESWEHAASGTVYPTAPGTIAGQMDDSVFAFRNFRAAEIHADFLAVRALLHAINPDMKFLLTVSPVPLTATASGDHVLPATVYSKSVLRTVAGELAQDLEDVDYFPSYEIVSSHPAAGTFYEENLRSISADGVKRVMATFLEAHAGSKAETKALARERRAKRRQAKEARKSDVVCEEELLEAFRE